MRGIHRSPVNSPHKGQRRGALMFSLICVWTNVEFHDILRMSAVFTSQGLGHSYGLQTKWLPLCRLFQVHFLLLFLTNVFVVVLSTIKHHWFKQWLGTEEVPRHYLNQRTIKMTDRISQHIASFQVLKYSGRSKIKLLVTVCHWYDATASDPPISYLMWTEANRKTDRNTIDVYRDDG